MMGSLHFFLLALSIPAGLASEIIPPSFPLQDPSQYTTRYLSMSDGMDSEDCLDGQPYYSSITGPDSVQYCNTLNYSLLGNSSDIYNVSNLILLVSPGVYDYGRTGLKLRLSSNLIIAKNPLKTGEVIFTCISYTTDVRNDLYIRYLENIALRGITFSSCGNFSSGVFLRVGENLLIDTCIFE